MKALVLAREGGKAVLLLPGGEMRTVRAQKGWQTGMEVTVRPYPLRKKKTRMNLRAVLYPLAACAAAFLIVFAGLDRLGGNHVDRQRPIEPLSSGSSAAVHTEAPEATGTPEPTIAPTLNATPMPAPTATPMPVSSTPEPSSGTESMTIVETAQPTPMRKEFCEECGEIGHDDDHCPKQVCEECGEIGHDDDHCPKQVCEECGEIGHDDDHCPNQVCDECGARGHDDDDCPHEHDD